MSDSIPHDGVPPVDAPSGLRTRVLRLLSRVTTSGSFVPEIDGLRFVAIAAVVLFHLLAALRLKSPELFAQPGPRSPVELVLQRGFHGVELFFIVSGFILALPFASHLLQGARAVRLPQYFLRRLTRLEPPYVLSLLLFFGVAVISKGREASALLPHLLASIVYLHNMMFGTESTVSIVAWSLEIEVQFYVLVPLLARVFAIRSKSLRRAVLTGATAALTVMAWLNLSPAEPRLYLSVVRYLQFFLTGFLLADIYLTDWNAKPAKSLRWDVLAAAAAALLILLWCLTDTSAFWAERTPGGESLLAAMLFPPLALVCYIGAFRGRIYNVVITNAWIVTIGGMCYSIYLLHTMLLAAAVDITRHLRVSDLFTVNYLAQCVVAVPAVLIPSALYFVLIEKPCMRRDWPLRLRSAIGDALRGRVTTATDPKRLAE